MKKLLFLLSFTAVSYSAFTQNCNQTSVGLIPINDLGTGTYNGWTGGLYPNGLNYMPAAHKNAGMALAGQIQPLNSIGNPDPMNGKIVWLSIGMSNTTMETQVFIPLANALPNKNPNLVFIDGAIGGQTASILSNPSDPGYNNYWSTVNNRLANAGVNANQVQVFWFKEDNPAGNLSLQGHYDSLLAQSKRIMNELKTRFPNSKLCYIASRIYGGYSTTTLNPEPYAYQNGWTMKKLIEDQINGDPMLQYSGSGTNSPWLSWGVYQWADGTTPRSDGLTWVCSDFNNDGTHPNPQGRQKVSNLLLNFFQTDSTACPWFLNNCAITTGIDEPLERSDFIIYPNPFSLQTVLRIDKYFDKATIIIFNSFSQKVKEIKNHSGQSFILYRDNLPEGTYYVQVTNGNGQTFKEKIIITD